jgi:hypothetical protein
LEFEKLVWEEVFAVFTYIQASIWTLLVLHSDLYAGVNDNTIDFVLVNLGL